MDNETTHLIPDKYAGITEYIFGLDNATLESQKVKNISGISPKVKIKNKFIQKILVKLFGYKLEYKTVDAMVMKIKAEDVPIGFNGDLTFRFD